MYEMKLKVQMTVKNWPYGRGGWMNHLFYIHFLISAATGAAAPGCSGTVNAAD